MDGKTDLTRRLADDLDGDATSPRRTLGCVGAVGEGKLDKWKAAARGLQYTTFKVELNKLK
jgi:2'-5' RNA ligase